MRRNKKKITACALVAMLSLTCAAYPVNAEDTLLAQQKETEQQSEIDETVVPMEKETTDSKLVSESSEFTSEPDTSENTEEFTDGTEQTEVEENVVPLADNTYNINESAVTIDAETNGECPGHTITGSSTSNNITVTGGTHNITLSDCNIDVSNINNKSAFSIENTATVNLTLAENNTLYSGERSAGLQVSDNATLVITKESLGSLTAKGGWYGAGIGGGFNGSGGTITFNGGIITATGGTKGSGIGSGDYGSGGTITINDGIITAHSDDYDITSIGNTNNLYGTTHTLTINGGNVTVDNIGVYDNNSNTFTITGGTLTADNFMGRDYRVVLPLVTGGSIKVKNMKYNERLGKDNQGNRVYLAKIDNLSGVNEVTVDGIKYTRDGDHSDGDGAFYLYLARNQDHIIETPTGTYKAIWKSIYESFTIKQVSPTPTVTIDSSKTTASSITLNPLENADTYGGAEYSTDNQNWQDSNVFENLSANTEYTVFARYKGNDTYAESAAGTVRVSTAPATYEITIPMYADADDSENTVSIGDTDNFDLGYNGKVNVKIKNTNDFDNGMLTLTRKNGSNETITSQLLVGGNPFTDLSQNVATFTNKNDKAIPFVFKRPTNTNILAGTYKGMVVFDISYSEN